MTKQDAAEHAAVEMLMDDRIVGFPEGRQLRIAFVQFAYCIAAEYQSIADKEIEGR